MVKLKTLDSILLTSSAPYSKSEAFLLVEYYDAHGLLLSLLPTSSAFAQRPRFMRKTWGKIGSHGTRKPKFMRF